MPPDPKFRLGVAVVYKTEQFIVSAARFVSLGWHYDLVNFRKEFFYSNVREGDLS